MKLHLPKMLAVALAAAFITTTQASGAITAANAAGWALFDSGNWVYSDSFDGSITTTAQSDIRFTDASGNFITFGASSRNAYTFAVELDLDKLATPTSPGSTMVWGGDTVGFGLDGNRKVTLAYGATGWDSTYTELPASGTVTIVVSTGDQGTRIYGYDEFGSQIFVKNQWLDKKASAPSTYFHIAQAISPAVTKFAVWQAVGISTASGDDMKNAYNAMGDFPPTEYTWSGTEQAHSLTSKVWLNAGGELVDYSETVQLVFGESGHKTVTIDSTVTTPVMVVQAGGYTFENTGSLTAQRLTVDSGASLSLTGTGTYAVIYTAAVAGSLSIGEGSTLKLNDGASAAQLLQTATGAGNITLSSVVVSIEGSEQKASAPTTQATGTLTLEHSTLKVGKMSTSGAFVDKYVDLSSFSHIGLDNATLWVHAAPMTVNGVHVYGGGTSYIQIQDKSDQDKAYLTLAGTTTVDAGSTLQFKGQLKGQTSIAALAGEGTLDLNGPGTSAQYTIGGGSIGVLKISSQVVAATISGDLSVGGLTGTRGTVNANQNLTFTGSGTYSYTGTLTVGGQITKTGTGRQTISGTALHRTILAQEGTLVLNGSYAIDAITDIPIVNTTVDYEGNESDNGFLKSSGTIIVYSGEGKLNLNAAHFTYATDDVTEAVKTGNGTYTLPESIDRSTVYVTTGSLDIANYKTDALTSVVLSNNTTVNMDAAATVGVALAAGASATVNATAATTLSGVTGLGDGQTLTITGTELVTLGSAITGSKVVVDNGRLNLGALTHTLSELSVTNGTVDISGVNSGAGCVSGTLTIGESATVTAVGHHDVFGNNDGSTKNIVMGGSEGKLAQLVLNSPNPNSVTMSANIVMNGYASITSTKGTSDKGFNTYGGTITVNGVENSIDVLDMRNNGVTITVNADGELEIKKVTIFGNQHGENTILVKAGEGLLTLSGASNLSDGLNISAGTVEVGGATTIGNLAGTGDLVVKEGGSLNVTGTVTNSNITVEDGGTIAGGVDATDVTIAAGGTAKFEQGVSDETSGVSFTNDGDAAVTIENIGIEQLRYGIDEETAKVTADCLYFGFYSEAETDVTVKNEVVVGEIWNFGKGNLTLTHVATDSLQSIFIDDGAVTLQNVSEGSIELKELCLPSNTVAVYKGAVADATQECTVTITNTLMAGGGTLLANLILKGDVYLDLALGNTGMSALTLGSQFGIDEGTLVTLDPNTISCLEGLSVGDSLQLINAAQGTVLTYGDDYNGMWFGQLFERTEGVQGDYRVYATETGFGLTKVSNVPEPATGTLSLLALAGLCARRRRK